MMKQFHKEIKHIFLLNGKDKEELNELLKGYFGVDNIKDIHIFSLDGDIETDVTCVHLFPTAIPVPQEDKE